MGSLVERLSEFDEHHSCTSIDLMDDAVDEIDRLQKDAARWGWIVRNCQSVSPHMDGTSEYHVRMPWGRGRSIGEVIDAALKAEV